MFEKPFPSSKFPDFLISNTGTPAQLKAFNLHRGAILSGPPGIGKTSAATLIAKSLGFEVVEFNASDKRSKKNMETLLDSVNSRVMTFGGKNTSSNKNAHKRVVIMDEVDGMSSGDRGGAAVRPSLSSSLHTHTHTHSRKTCTQALADVIRKSRSPVICICNDLQKKSLTSLKSVCLGLPFRRPMKITVRKRMMAIARKEGMSIEDNAMDTLIESVGNDIRQVLNALQMISRSKSKVSIRYSDMKERIKTINKDSILRMTPFTGVQELFNQKKPFNRRYEAFFVDYSLVPLMVQENYVNVCIVTATRIYIFAHSARTKQHRYFKILERLRPARKRLTC